jgi:hypothetical protein
VDYLDSSRADWARGSSRAAAGSTTCSRMSSSTTPAMSAWRAPRQPVSCLSPLLLLVPVLYVNQEMVRRLRTLTGAGHGRAEWPPGSSPACRGGHLPPASTGLPLAERSLARPACRALSLRLGPPQSGLRALDEVARATSEAERSSVRLASSSRSGSIGRGSSDTSSPSRSARMRKAAIRP